MKKHITAIKLSLLIIVTSNSIVSYAQQDPLYAQYLNNPILLNPAYTGSNQQWQTTAGYRTQWAGFEGNPTTMNFASHLSLVDNRVGVGLIAVQDKIGEVKNTEFTLNYSFRIEVKENKHLYFGLSTGMTRYNSDPGLLNLQTPTDPAFNFVNKFQFNTGAGLMLKTETFMIGLSVPKLLPTSINENNTTIQIYNQHYYLFGVFTHNFNERVMFKPAMLLKATQGASLSADVNVNFVFDQSYTMGVLTRNLNTFGLLAQAKLKQYRFGYVFEMPTNKSVGQRFSSHEVSFTYSLPFLDFHDRSLFSNF